MNLPYHRPTQILSARHLLALALLLAPVPAALGADPTEKEIETRFTATILPFLQTHCTGCHGPEKNKGKLDLSPYSNTSAIARDHLLWKTVLEKLESKEMPPEEARSHPTPPERRAVIDWINTLRTHEALKNAGDPGIVLARRLSNAEYDHTIRDLTGVNIRPTREFPVDPANEAGFDNSGESLAMSPALLKKYLEAAQHVAHHLVLLPAGFTFAPHPAITDSDRDKFAVARLIKFYERHHIDYADYFLAAWRYRHRQVLKLDAASPARIAQRQNLSPRYLSDLWDLLNQSPPDSTSTPESGPIARLQQMWRALPSPDPDTPEPIEPAVRQGCETMRKFVVETRQQLVPKVGELRVNGISAGSQPLLLWKNRQYAENRRAYLGGAIELDGQAFGRTDHPREQAILQQFCSTFPDAFFLSERGRMNLDPKSRNSGRLLSAGFHLMMGYFRDDRPLYDLILDADGRSELDRLWQELNFVTSAPTRQYKDFIFFERAEPPRFMQRAEFDFARSEDKDATSQAKIDRLAERYLAKARDEHQAGTDALQAIEFYFSDISRAIREVESDRQQAEPSHLQALLTWTERAYRRPLTLSEREDSLAFYRVLRSNGLSHEEAMHDSVAGVLMSPHFCYRLNLPLVSRDDPSSGKEAIRPLSAHDLASRLSYFLWSSMPDEELLSHAASGELQKREMLEAQTRRLLRDSRIRGLATEFAGHWLGFRRFEEHNSVDRGLFKSFTDELRQAMYEEPIRFFVDLVERDGSVLEFLYADHTLANPVLARHYGMPNPRSGSPAANEWKRIDTANRYGRGGLLPMSVFLTMNAPGRRTSPVKRGYWVVRRILGEHIPAPPPNVPELPDDESKTGDLTLPQLLARHREHKNCAGCHDRFDSIGLAFEGYGPVGERRTRDLAGRPVQTGVAFPGDSSVGEGLTGLQTYLRSHRQADFIDNLCRKLLSYALGRGLLLSDDPLVESMRSELAADQFRFGRLVETIVTSPQFLTLREAP